MIISHSCRFIIFIDPLDEIQWLKNALAPWSDEEISSNTRSSKKSAFFTGMTPVETRKVMAERGIDFDSYTRIAIVQNPFRRMAALYDRMRASNPVWRLMALAGRKTPDFHDWLMSGHFMARGPFARLAPRWRDCTSMQSQSWNAGEIDCFARAEFAAADLRLAFRKLDIPPAVDLSAGDKPHRFPELLRYDNKTLGVIRRYFGDDLRLYAGLGAGLELVA